jgi:hypothetical protein
MRELRSLEEYTYRNNPDVLLSPFFWFINSRIEYFN